jgi:hypothetical protein
MINILFVLLFSKIKLAIPVISFGIECFYFFALMQKSNKKFNPPRRTKIKELAGRVFFFEG